MNPLTMMPMRNKSSMTFGATFLDHLVVAVEGDIKRFIFCYLIKEIANRDHRMGWGLGKKQVMRHLRQSSQQIVRSRKRMETD